MEVRVESAAGCGLVEQVPSVSVTIATDNNKLKNNFEFIIFCFGFFIEFDNKFKKLKMFLVLIDLQI
jgi:hypothetical protein